MADITYTVNQDDPNNIPGFENYSQADLNLIQQYQINSLFDTNKNFIELYITDLLGNIIESDVNYTSYRLLGTAQSAGSEGASVLTIDPIQDSKSYGYENGGIKLLYHFLNDPYTLDKTTTQFYISAISPDRTEIQLQNLDLTNEEIISYTATIKSNLDSQAYYGDFRLNFGNNDLLIGINIDTLPVGENETVVVKLYEPLPANYSEKSTLSIVETVSDSVAFEVDTIYEFPEEASSTLRPANFNLDLTDNQVVPTQYLNYTDLFSYPVNNTNNQLYSLVSEKGAELSIDHTDYSDFVHFSSAYERLVNFKYKLQLIESYNTSLGLVQAATSQSVGTTGSVSYYENLITGVVNNFDHYERYLYYQSSSYAWPKSNSTVPYVNYPSTSSQAVNWYANQLAVANKYDLTNGSILINSIPTYLRDDPNNENYITFIHMIGQHFDNLWIYAKAVTDKYDGDNRLDFGISKDLVGEALRNFGVKLYTSNKSIENLFGSFIGEGYQSGSEVINTYVTGSVTGSGLPITDVSFDDYTKEVQKRIYHNLPFILKTKGTERGVRALINCYGIPSDILKIKLYGGRDVDERPFYGDYEYYTSSLDKVRLDNTGSIVTGSTLSSHTSIIKRDAKYTDDLHTVEIGFSPTDNIDNLIVSYSLATASLSTFNIDDYIGDPRSLTADSYAILDSSANQVYTLRQLTDSIMSGSTAYDVQDYVRLIKFFDNTVFKMVRDFIPGRAAANTGIIVKPHLLHRSKAKSVQLIVSRSEYSQSIDTGFASASSGDTFGSRDQYTTITLADVNDPLSNYRFVQTPSGLGRDYRHGHEETKFDGDFSGSNVIVTDGNLTKANQYTTQIFTALNYNILLVSGSDVVCFLEPAPTPIQIIPGPPQQYQVSTFFLYTNPSTIYTASVAGGSTVYPDFPYTFTDADFEQYDVITLQATSSNVANCQKSVQALYASCSVTTTSNFQSEVSPYLAYDIATWFTPINSNIEYIIDGQQYTRGEVSNYIFDLPAGVTHTVVARDVVITNYGLTCNSPQTVLVNGGCPIAVPSDNGNSYRYNDSRFPVEGLGSSAIRYTIARDGVGTTIKSLFTSPGINDPDTRFRIKLVFPPGGADDLSQYDAYINPGQSPSYDTDAGQITGNEQFVLKYLTPDGGIPTWGWEITGGTFQINDVWSGYAYGDVPYLVDALYIAIEAYSINPIYGICTQTVLIKPPLTAGIPTCDYYCVANPGGGYTVVGAPTNNPDECFADSSYCDYLNL
jgi:hypothetical protein